MYQDGNGATKSQIQKYTGHKSQTELEKYLQINEDEEVKSPLTNNK